MVHINMVGMMHDEYGPWDGDTSTIRAQDQAFCVALMLAVDAGHEQVPMVGIDVRPCTTHPQMVGAATAPSWGGWLAT